MVNALQGVTIYAHCYTWSEALCSMLYMNSSFMHIAVHRVKLYSQSYRRREALCSLL